MLRTTRMEAIRVGVRWGLRKANAFGTPDGILNDMPPIPRKLTARDSLIEQAFDHVYEKAKNRKLASVSPETCQRLTERQQALAIAMDNTWAYFDKATQLAAKGYREKRPK